MLWIARLVCTSKIAATLCLGLVALLGDHIVIRSALSEDVRAFVDNITHGAIGLLSWYIVTAHLGDLSLSMRVCEVVFCGLIASAVDLDHFFAARSLRIQVLQPYTLLCLTGVLSHIGFKWFHLEVQQLSCQCRTVEVSSNESGCIQTRFPPWLKQHLT
jgi:hypothetical protein